MRSMLYYNKATALRRTAVCYRKIILYMEPTSPTPQNSLATPLAIVVGFALIAVAIYFSGIGKSTTPPPTTVATNQNAAAAAGAVRPVDETDYIRGNPNAPIMIVEYSDYDCPFCQVFHETMNQIMNEYGLGGRVAWVYRQMPIAALHPNSPKLSEAALCVGELAGQDAFWKFSDSVFRSREVNQQTNMTKVAALAADAGADPKAFNDCYTSRRMKDKVDASVNEGMAAGIEGTPHSSLLVGNQQAVIEGAQPYEAVRSIIDNLVKQLDGAEAGNSTTDTTANPDTE